jgi:hypothetical protein
VVFLSRLIAALAYAGAAFLFGVLLGERGELGPVQYVFMAVIPLATAVLAFFSRDARAEVAATGAAMLLGLLLGQRQFDRAWAECERGAPRVRAALIAFHEKNDAYPARLEDLGIDLPCRCGFRRTILRYLSNERGFRLWYTNDRETRVLTASETASGRRVR